METTILGNLLGIATISPTEVWAIGRNDNESLVLRWRDGSWSVVPTPKHGIVGGNYPIAVGGTSSSEIWAVGTSNSIMYWNGTEWDETTVVTAHSSSELQSIVVRSSNDIWAVGGSSWGGGYASTVLHWDGTEWSEVFHPSLKPDQTFYDIYIVDEQVMVVGGIQPRDEFNGLEDFFTHNNPLIAQFTERSCAPEKAT